MNKVTQKIIDTNDDLESYINTLKKSSFKQASRKKTKYHRSENKFFKSNSSNSEDSSLESQASLTEKSEDTENLLQPFESNIRSVSEAIKDKISTEEFLVINQRVPGTEHRLSIASLTELSPKHKSKSPNEKSNFTFNKILTYDDIAEEITMASERSIKSSSLDISPRSSRNPQSEHSKAESYKSGLASIVSEEKNFEENYSEDFATSSTFSEDESSVEKSSSPEQKTLSSHLTYFKVEPRKKVVHAQVQTQFMDGFYQTSRPQIQLKNQDSNFHSSTIDSDFGNLENLIREQMRITQEFISYQNTFQKTLENSFTNICEQFSLDFEFRKQQHKQCFKTDLFECWKTVEKIKKHLNKI